MRTKNPDPRAGTTPAVAPSAPSVPGSVAFWLEDDLGRRVSKLFRSSERPLKLAGRVLENVGHVDGWTVAYRDTSGNRHVLAAGADLADFAAPFMPPRTPEEAARLSRHFEALRRDPAFPSRAAEVTDERVY